MSHAQQLPKLASVVVEHQEQFGRLSTRDAQWAIKNPQVAIQLACDAITNRMRPKSDSVLVCKGTVTIPASNDTFFVSDHFVVVEGTLDIGEIEPTFHEWFGGMREDFVYKTTLRYFVLPSSTSDIELTYLLGREDDCSVRLRHIHSLIQMGQKSPLLRGGYHNVFYVVDKNFELRRVNLFEKEGKWKITVESFARSFAWSIQGLVFSR